MSNIIILFEVTVKSGKKEGLANAEGFIRSERFSSLSTNGKPLNMSIWKNEECVSKWRSFAAHRMAQKHGRTNDFTDYKIIVVPSVRTHTMTDRTEVPASFDEYLKV